MEEGGGGGGTTHTKGVRGRVHVSLTGIATGAYLADMAMPLCVETIVLTNKNLRE